MNQCLYIYVRLSTDITSIFQNTVGSLPFTIRSHVVRFYFLSAKRKESVGRSYLCLCLISIVSTKVFVKCIVKIFFLALIHISVYCLVGSSFSHIVSSLLLVSSFVYCFYYYLLLLINACTYSKVLLSFLVLVKYLIKLVCSCFNISRINHTIIFSSYS